MNAQTELSQELIGEFVQAAHFNPDKVKALHRVHPELLNARWAKYQETALEAAAHMGQVATARYLLAAGAPLDICAAAMLGETEKVAKFLEDDPSLYMSRGAHGISLIYHAALSGETAVTELLLKQGPLEGMAGALHGAVRCGHAEMLVWLLANGADDLNVKNFEGKTPLQVAQEKDDQAIVTILRQHGAG